MHSLSVPADSKIIISPGTDPIAILNSFFALKIKKFLDFGISSETIISNIIFDPGLGFSKGAVESWYVLNNLTKLNTIGAELLLGHSRKSFFNYITNKDFKERDIHTAFIAVQLVNLFGIVRIHDTITTMEMFSIKANLPIAQI